MRIAIMGAGAVGCHLGGRLARAGHEVTLIGRERLAAATRDGLRVESTVDDTDERIDVRVETDPAVTADADVVLVCTKTTADEEVGRLLAPHLRPCTLVVAVQNGLDGADRLRSALARDDVTVSGCVIYVAVGMAGPGHVRHVGGGRLVLADDSGHDDLAAVLADAIEVERSADVRTEQWTKLTVNCVWNALSALTGLTYGDLADRPGVREIAQQVAAECEAVAAADGTTLTGTLDQALGLVAVMPGQHSSTAQDLAARRRTEIDDLNGYVVRRGAELGVATPANQVLLSLTLIAQEQALS